MDDITEEQFDNPELWAELQAAWTAIATADATYYEGVDKMEDGDAWWDAYDLAESDSERIEILDIITGFYWDAWDCFDSAAADYFLIADELEDLCEEVDDSLVTAMNNWINLMNAAKAAMETQKTASQDAATPMTNALGQANASKTAALAHTPTNQGAYDTLMNDGNNKLGAGETLQADGNLEVAKAEEIANGTPTSVGANDLFDKATKETLPPGARLIAAASARDKFLAMSNRYGTAVQRYNAAKTNYEEAKTKFDSAQMQ